MNKRNFSFAAVVVLLGLILVLWLPSKAPTIMPTVMPTAVPVPTVATADTQDCGVFYEGEPISSEEAHRLPGNENIPAEIFEAYFTSRCQLGAVGKKALEGHATAGDVLEAQIVYYQNFSRSLAYVSSHTDHEPSSLEAVHTWLSAVRLSEKVPGDITVEQKSECYKPDIDGPEQCYTWLEASGQGFSARIDSDEDRAGFKLHLETDFGTFHVWRSCDYPVTADNIGTAWTCRLDWVIQIDPELGERGFTSLGMAASDWSK